MNSEKELNDLFDMYEVLFNTTCKKLEQLQFSDAIANILREIMDGIDKARCTKKAKRWSREEILKLIELLNIKVNMKG